MQHPFIPTIYRLRVTPDDLSEEPAFVSGPRPRGSRRPHGDAAVAQVRRLVEQTTLTYKEIEARTGVNYATACYWKRSGDWQRPPFAARAPDAVPTVRAGHTRKLRLLAERLRAIAERYTRELEETPDVDLDKLVQAFEVLKMARAETMIRRRHRFFGPAATGTETLARDEAVRTALKEMRRGGVDIDRIPQPALDLLIDARIPPENDHPALRPWEARRRR